jgi:hypothetical protein
MHNSLVLGGSLVFHVFCLLPALHKLLCVTPNLLLTGVIVTGKEFGDPKKKSSSSQEDLKTEE